MVDPSQSNQEINNQSNSDQVSGSSSSSGDISGGAVIFGKGGQATVNYITTQKIELQDQFSESLPSIRKKVTESPSFTKAVSQYLETLQSFILRDYRQDQYITLTIEALDSEDIETINALKMALETSFKFEVSEFDKGGATFIIDEVINQSRLVTLLGDPGIGKTTSLRYLVLKSIDAYKANTQDLLPVWISLAEWDLEKKDISAIEFVYSRFIQHFGPEEIEQKEFAEWLYAGELILFFDGLNELPQRERSNVVREDFKQKENPKKQFDPRENNLLVLARDTQSHFVLSCRVREYVHYPRWRDFLITPLSEKQISNLINKHLNEDSSRLEKLIEEQPQLQILLRNPFFLRSIILLVQEYWKDVPKDRFQVVQFTCLATLHRELAHYPLTIDQVIKNFGGASLELMNWGNIGSTFTISKEFLLTNDNTEDTDYPQLGEAIQIVEASGLLIRVVEDQEHIRYRYLHQLIQEAFTLLYIQQEDGDDEVNREVKALTEVGEIHSYWGLIKESQDNFERALEICPVVGAEVSRANILINQSRLARKNRQTHQSLSRATTAVELAEVTNDKELKAKAYHELGNVNLGLRNKKEAENNFQSALNIRKEIGDLSQIAYEKLWGLGDFYSNTTVYKIKNAIVYQKAALRHFEHDGNDIGIALAKEELAHSYRLWGEVVTSEKLFQECIDEFAHLERPRDQLGNLFFLGLLYRDMRRFNDAKRIIKQAYELSTKHSSTSDQVDILLFGLAYTNVFQGKYNLALEFVDEAHKIAQKQGAIGNMLDVYYFGYRFVHWHAKRFKESAESYNLYREHLDEEGRLKSGIHKKLVGLWAQILGEEVSSNKLAYVTNYFLWLVFKILIRVSRPTNWFGKQIWRLNWWINTI